MGAWRVAAFESLDNDHAAAAARTGMREHRRLIGIGITGLVLRSGRVEQFSHPRDVLDALAAGEQAVVADAVEAAGERVNEESANELVGRERHHLEAVASLGPVILP